MAENQLTTVPMSKYLSQPNVSAYLEQVLGERKAQFVVAMTSLANSSDMLKKCDKQSILACGITAVGMNLELNPQLGFAYSVPYGDKAQFQIGYKGLIQLALRTGKYKKINAVPVYQNQFKSYNALTEELDADFTKDGDGEIVGYVAYFKMIDGYEKLLYWSKKKVTDHGKKFSKTFGNGPWKSDYDGMALKTVLKQLLSKWGAMTTELANAISKDQSVIKLNVDTGEEEIEYIDNPTTKDVTLYITKTQAELIMKNYPQDKVSPILKERGIKRIEEIPLEELESIIRQIENKPTEYTQNEFDGTPLK